MEADSEVFRVRVDLRRVCSDERSRVVLGVPRGGRGRVRWLARRVRALLARPAARLALLLDGHLLPETEPLALLRPGDELTVIPVQGKWDPSGEEGGWSSGTEADSTLASPPHKRTRNDDQEKEELLRREKMRALELLDAVSAAPLVPAASPPADIVAAPPEPIVPPPPAAILPAAEPDPLPLAPYAMDQAPIDEPLPRVRPRRRRRRRRPLQPECNLIQDSSMDQEQEASEDSYGSNMQLHEVALLPKSSATMDNITDAIKDRESQNENMVFHDVDPGDPTSPRDCPDSIDFTNAPNCPDARDLMTARVCIKANEGTTLAPSKDFGEGRHPAASLDVPDGAVAAAAAARSARRGRIIHAIDSSSS
ncbi:unnamed protein product [Plutella xylostella]|uniref:(diamondback moth) hypothetical protein n=1 Tax=Plutella xylostella TaxID=51655 RepID=A0A8S4DEE6_PLUXY|nr:unnamed protein product [Plutella xylostella]